MFDFFKPSLSLLSRLTACFVLLGSSALSANSSSHEPIPAEQIREAANQLSQFSQLEKFVDNQGLIALDSTAADFSIPFLGQHRHHNHRHHDCSSHRHGCSDSYSHDSHCHHDAIESRTLRMTFSMSEPIGVLPVDYNIDVTPFAISPNGQKYVGVPTNISISTTAIVQPLNAVFVPHITEGTYTVGYTVTLGAGSAFAPGDPAALFNVVVLNREVSGLRKQTVNSEFVALSFSDLVYPYDFLAVAANCELLNHKTHHGHNNDFEKAPEEESVTINMNAFYGNVALPVPPGSVYNFTPFAVAPNGKVIRGQSIPLVLAASNFIGVPLPALTIPRPIYGNYFVGYEISLAVGSLPANPSTLYNFFGGIRLNQVGNQRESVNFPTQLLPLGSLLTPSDSFRVTTNFLIPKP